VAIFFVSQSGLIEERQLQRHTGNISPMKDIYLKHSEKIAVIFLFIALTLLLGQHWGMTLSNSDDPWIVRATIAEIFNTASVQGRFWLIPINLMAQAPYHLGSWEAANAIKISVNGLVLILFIVFCTRLTNRWVGVLIGLIWLAFIDVSPGYYSPFHGYLMMFNLQFATLFGSFIWYLKILDSDKPKRRVIGPYFLYAFSLLAYEPMLFYAAVYPALMLYRYFQGNPSRLGMKQWWDLILQFFKSNYWLAITVGAYLLTYFAYRRFQPTSGRGVDTNGNAIDIIKTIYRFSVNGFHFQPKALTNYIEGVSSPTTLAVAVVYALVITLACLVLIPRVHGPLHPSRLSGKAALATLSFFVFCPNLLHGFVQGYRQWAAEDPHYVGNYFSSFPLAIVATLGILFLAGGRRATQEKILFGLILVLVACSACDNYIRWGNLADANRRDSALWWQAIIELKRSDLDPRATTIVCGKNPPEKVSGDDRYWSLYLSEVLDKKVEFKSKALDTVKCDKTLQFNRYRFTQAAL
jgi:hypothetical protein